ncbi:hypothetical protein [Microbacterium marmarense]|uniref:Amidohydrolase-related domain-containing protein n=1 Tax=Microbacterium marmarense TaxID=3122051 RepID=A0ABU8LQ71_9MICO
MNGNPFALRALLGPSAVLCRTALTGSHGVALPPFIDHHVHLHLIDESGFAAGGIAGVVDLGGDPVALARRPLELIPHLAYAGAILTAQGGYPSGRTWAPSSIWREVTDSSLHPGVAGGAATAVEEQVAFGAAVIKIALHSDTAVFDAATLGAIVEVAHENSLPVVAHVQGEGMLRLALDAEVDVLAHAPFSEALTPDLVSECVEAGQQWVSTLDIHRDAPAAISHATQNLAAFAAADGRVLYGTDLGNGELPVGINVREVAAIHAAGIQGSALIDTLIDAWPYSDALAGVATFIPGDPPASIEDIPRWLANATVVPHEELVHDD